MEIFALNFYRKKNSNLLYILLLGFLTALLAYIGITQETKNILGIIIIAGMFFDGFCLFFLYMTLDNRPLVAINENGLKAIYHQPSFIKWEDIKEVFEQTTSGQYSNDTFICLNLKNKRLLERQNLYYKICTWINTKTGFGEINIWGSILKFSSQELLFILSYLATEKDVKKRRKFINSYKMKVF